MKYRNTFFNTTFYGKLLMLAFTVLLLTFGASIQVYASEMDTVSENPEPVSTMEYTITGIENSEQLGNLAPFELVRRSIQNTEPFFYHIYNNGLLYVTANIEDSNGNTTSQRLFVSWTCWDNSTTVTNTTVCGDYIETGIIQLPDDSYKWGEGVLSVLALPVRVYDPAEPVEIVELYEVWNEFDVAFSLEQNDSIEELLLNEEDTISLQTAWPCFDADGNEYLCPVVYNTENVIEDTVGMYNITVTFNAPLNCRFSENLDLPTYSIPVTVQASGQPRLDASYLSPSTEFIIFPWITSGIDLDSMEVWMSENDGEWRMLKLNQKAYIHPTMLEIYAWDLTGGYSYQIQVDYEGGRTGIASFTYGWDILSDKGYIEGDRDGGDTDGNPPTDSEDAENPLPTPPGNSTDNGNSSTEETNNYTDSGSNTVPPISEAVEALQPITDTTVLPKEPSPNREVLSDDTDHEPATETPVSADAESNREEPYLLGSEIALMLENLGTAHFSEETIMLDIPEDAIASLNISGTDRLLVTVLPLENNSFSIDISVNDVAVTTLSGMQISLPYQPAENTTPVLMNEDNEKVADGDYTPQTGLVSFTINETGTFYIQDEEVPMQDTFSDNTLAVTEITTSDKSNDNSVFKLIAAVAAVTVIGSAAGVAIFVYTKKRRT